MEQHGEEVATEAKPYDLTAMSFPQPPHEEELKWSGVKLHLTRRDEGGFGFIFYYPTLLLSVNKLSQVWFAQTRLLSLDSSAFLCLLCPTLLMRE